MDKKGNNKAFNIFMVLSYVFLVLLFIIAMFLVFYIATSAYAKKTKTKPIFSLFTIVSPSMEPNIMVYDVIFDKKVNNNDELNVGDIITFYSDAIDTNGYTITHRIYKKYIVNNTVYYETKGDNNNSPDVGKITIDNIVGKYVFKMPMLGKVQFFVSSKLGWVLLILIPAVIIVFSDVMKILKASSIKKELDSIDTKVDGKKVKNIKDEQERDKKIRALIQKADKMNKK
jgi:signal peptidase